MPDNSIDSYRKVWKEWPANKTAESALRRDAGKKKREGRHFGNYPEREGKKVQGNLFPSKINGFNWREGRHGERKRHGALCVKFDKRAKKRDRGPDRASSEWTSSGSAGGGGKERKGEKGRRFRLPSVSL